MSEKENPKVEAEFKYGVAPSLIINMVKENRVYRFEMPIGAKLPECEQACEECLKIVKQMLKEALEKQEEAEKKAAEEVKEEESEIKEEESEIKEG